MRVLCEKIDGIGLRNYIDKNYKDKIRVEAELLEEFRSAPDAGEMVLQSLEGFYRVSGNFNDRVLRKMGRICVMLLKVLSVAGVNVSGKAREKALKLAIDWKVRLLGDHGNILGALGFLYLVYGFGIVSEFRGYVLVEFAARAAINGEFMQLCRDIGFTDKVPEIVQKLVEKGKHVLAVKFVFEFSLADKIPPVPILKAAVDESRKLARRRSEEGKRRMEITDRELRVLKRVIEIIEIHKLESEYPRDSLEQRIEQLKGQDPNMKDRTPASILNQHTLQRRQQKRRMKKQQQQNGNKVPRTSTSVGPAAVLKNDTNNDNSTMRQYQQPLVNPSGLFPEHPNPYKIPQATSSGMVASIPTIPSYTGPSTGPYGFAGIPMGPGGNLILGGSHLNSSEPRVPSAFYGSNNFTYGGINRQHHYQAPYYPQ